MSRYTESGFDPRFVVRRTDGQPCRPEARYMVLDGSGADPIAKLALKFYAILATPAFGRDGDFGRRLRELYGECIVERGELKTNADLAADIDRMLAGEWPAELAQHENAK